MSKRVRFDEDSAVTKKIGKYEEAAGPSGYKSEFNTPGSRFKENHSIDSDDDDDDEENTKKKEDYEKLTEEDVEGAENEDISGDYEEEGGPIITPFNLKEEMSEGDFDTAGHYHFKKEKEIRDNWLDNIDWVNVKKSKKSEDVMMDDDDDEQEKEPFDEMKTIQGIVHLLRKGETVSKGLRRLGEPNKAKKKGNSRSWQSQKVYDLEAEETADDPDAKAADEMAERKKQFLELTELADQMAGSGHYDIYSDTFEKLQHKLNSLQVSKQAAVEIPEDADSDDALDLFANDIDSTKQQKSNATESSTQSQENGDTDDSVKWEYKWNSEETELFGPFTSTQMATWKEQGYFKDEVKVRRADKPDAAFYNVARVDFDLYD